MDYDLVNGEISFVCSICERKFKIKSELRMHVNTIHEGKEIKCSSCPALFDFNSNLQEHLKGQLISKCPYENPFHPKYQLSYFWISALNFL